MYWMQNASSIIYPSDLNDSEWQLLQPLLPAAAKRGRPRERDLRAILNGIFYLLRSGCAWRLLPKEFGPWPTVHDYYRQWRQRGIWEQVNHTLRQAVRQAVGKAADPSAAILDSQTIKTGDQACASGYDAGKKIEGRKRHVVVDTLGLLLLVLVGPANIQDRDGARPLLRAVLQLCGGLRKVWADGGYAGALVNWFRELAGRPDCDLEIVRRLAGQAGFHILPKRWIVERTLSWLVKSRRLARDYETLPKSSESIIYLAMIRLMLKRLTNVKP
jgi:putative transposase